MRGLLAKLGDWPHPMPRGSRFTPESAVTPSEGPQGVPRGIVLVYLWYMVVVYLPTVWGLEEKVCGPFVGTNASRACAWGRVRLRGVLAAPYATALWSPVTNGEIVRPAGLLHSLRY